MVDKTLSTIAGGGGAKQKSEAFTSSGTWTQPDGVDAIRFIISGAGGGGANRFATNNTAGGGGGGEIITGELRVTGDITVTIGAGGGGAATAGTEPGADGGNTTLTGGISQNVQANGGKKGELEIGGDGGGKTTLADKGNQGKSIASTEGEMGTSSGGSAGGAAGGHDDADGAGSMFAVGGAFSGTVGLAGGGGGAGIGNGGNGAGDGVRGGDGGLGAGGGGSKGDGGGGDGGGGYVEIFWLE